MVSPGNRMPFCAGLGDKQSSYSFDVQAGRAAVLVLGGALPASVLDPLIRALATRRPESSDLVLLLGYSAGAQVWESGPGAGSGAAVVLCHDEFFARCGVPTDAPLVVVIDRASRVVASWVVSWQESAATAEAIIGTLRQIGAEPARDCVLPAPVIAVPGLLDDVLCRNLIDGFEAGATFDSGVNGVDAEGWPIDRLNHNKKRRRDWMLQPDENIHTRVIGELARRCVPEIKRATHCEMAHVDRMLVARYDDSGGYFRRHRDNAGQSVAFRQFALSINLNADFEGGHLLFPEYNDHRYRPAAGDGIIFSASLLHEAAPVTLGRRYVLLTFLHDAAAEARRVAERKVEGLLEAV